MRIRWWFKWNFLGFFVWWIGFSGSGYVHTECVIIMWWTLCVCEFLCFWKYRATKKKKKNAVDVVVAIWNIVVCYIFNKHACYIDNNNNNRPLPLPLYKTKYWLYYSSPTYKSLIQPIIIQNNVYSYLWLVKNFWIVTAYFWYYYHFSHYTTHSFSLQPSCHHHHQCYWITLKAVAVKKKMF